MGNSFNGTHAEFFAGGDGITIKSCDIRDGLGGIRRNPDGQWFIYEDNIDNIDKDPLFINPDRGDYRLSRNSPAKNMGADASLAGNLSVAPIGKKLVLWADIKRR